MCRPSGTLRREGSRIGLGATALTALPAAVADESIAVRCRHGGAGTDQAAPWFTVVNTGTTNIPLSQVKLCYYFKADPGASYSYACDRAVKGCTHQTGTFGTPANSTATADRYLEAGFTAGAGSLAPGADTGDVRLRFHRSDWQPLDRSDDYSFGPAQTTYGNWTKVTATIGGVQVWGTAPAGNFPILVSRRIAEVVRFGLRSPAAIRMIGWPQSVR
ncbi:cellulose binding domain-containing protein [Streptomyces sp. P9-A4]|uniref:cellulose binding domain-containing protein n=1 Tax=Streptomyces sp. P9-A4 TaxID=3072285 RepID=UPI003FCC4CC8